MTPRRGRAAGTRRRRIHADPVADGSLPPGWPPRNAAPRPRWAAPAGWAGFGRVVAHIPQVARRRIVAVLVVSLSCGAGLELLLRSVARLTNERGGPREVLLAMGLVVAWPGLLFLGARRVAALVLRTPVARRAERPLRRARWPIDFAFGLGAILSMGAGGVLAAILFGLMTLGRTPTGFPGMAAIILSTLALAAAPALVGASWMGSAARHVIPEPRPYGFPLQLARSVCAWVVASACIAGASWSVIDLKETHPTLAWWRILLTQVLPVAATGWVLAAVTEIATPRRADGDLATIFE